MFFLSCSHHEAFDQGFNLLLSPGQTNRQVVASGRKLNLGRDLRWVAKRTRKFARKYTQVAVDKTRNMEHPGTFWNIE